MKIQVTNGGDMNIVQFIKSSVLISTVILTFSNKLQAEDSQEKDSKSFQLTSTSFKNLGPIPKPYTCNGADISPELSWENPPPGTRSFVLIVDDPDGIGGTRDHWVVYNIPGAVFSTKEGETPMGSTVGVHDANEPRYRGPCPPDRNHRYYFKIYALKQPLELPDGATKKQVEKAMKPLILGQAELVGIY